MYDDNYGIKYAEMNEITIKLVDFVKKVKLSQ